MRTLVHSTINYQLHFVNGLADYKIEIVNCGRFWGFPLFAAAAAM